MAFTTLTSTLLKISGTVAGPGGTIAAGATLTTARLTTIEDDLGPQGTIQINYDAYQLSAGEALSFRINGVEVAVTLPQMFTTSVTTNAGTFTALAFTIGGDTYLLPQGAPNVSGITSLTAPATLNSVAVIGVVAATYGLIPENASTFTGQVYTEVTGFGGGPTTTSVTTATLYDADGIRGNADSFGEEVGTGGLTRISEAVEVSATLLFNDGTSLSGVEGLVTILSAAYADTTYQFVFNEAKLAAIGKSLSDIADTTWQVSNHSLNWVDLGFDLVSGGDGIVTPDPTPTILNVITGTGAKNTLTGTIHDDVIRGLGGNDVMRGGTGGDDYFVFGNETRNGVRETDVIRDYVAGEDSVIFEDNALVRSVVNIRGGVQITFEGDRDRVNVYGDGVTVQTVGIFADDAFSFI